MVPCPLYAVSDVNNSICQDMSNLGTVITHTTTSEIPSLHTAKLSNLWLICAQSNLFWRHSCIHLLCTDRSQITKVPKVGGLWLHKLQWQEKCLTLSACSVVISYIRVWQDKACALIIPLGAQGQLLHTYTHMLPAIDSICPLTQSTAHPIRYIREILYYWLKLREYRQSCEKLAAKEW